MEGLDIFDPQGMSESMRHNEYSDICSAIAEIVDNSIEAKAKNITIYVDEQVSKDGVKVIGNIAILDDGTGMDETTLQRCLVYGKSSRDGQSIGRFGVGLGQASLFAAPRVEVYSWQKSEIKMVFLDCDLMKSGMQNKIEPPISVILPKEVQKVLEQSAQKDSGTIVLWKNVDKVVYQRLGSFYKKLSLDIGVKFRYFIHDGCRINLRKNLYDGDEVIKAIDPLFIMPNTRYSIMPDSPIEYLDSGTDTIFEPYVTEATPNGLAEFFITVNGVPEKVIVKCSVVKKAYYYDSIKGTTYKAPGNTKVGKMLKKFEGISIVRARREIDFGRFDFYDVVNDPVNRWWGIEISFEPKLDEFFSVSNNKQHVDLKSKVNDEDESSDWYLIKQFIVKIIKNMKSRNKQYVNQIKKDEANFITSSPKDDLGYQKLSDNSTGDTNIIEKRLESLGYIAQRKDFESINGNVKFEYTYEMQDIISVKYAKSVMIVYIKLDSEFYTSLLKKNDVKELFEKTIYNLHNARMKLSSTSDQIVGKEMINLFIKEMANTRWREK